ncbi:ribonuclease HII [Mesobaculum littorinae]|uniref:Ribonuclease HII n=1 Tax=Mesobaculum littorinae TaxID=2486419 RepID=A0A438AH78_9RHOB|nr:ribonuclease HII [Mesobaculum littorinae]RVV98073.1 ribonuclease HII [Mesobaculum littorinae]
MKDSPAPKGPSFAFEDAARARGALRIAGVDEVGRGPLAGPVTAAAVVLDIRAVPEGLNDSKKLGRARRERLSEELHRCAEVSIAHASVEEIDSLNILRASHLAMQRALQGLSRLPCHALIDGHMLPRNLCCPGEPAVRGDARSLSIAAASIVAKVARDRIMVELAQHYPGYGWDTNAGYGTKAHHAGLRDLGVTPHHRRSFKPIHNILWQEDLPSL